MRPLFPTLAAALLLSGCATAVAPPPSQTVEATPTEVAAPVTGAAREVVAQAGKGMVSAADPRAAEAGAELLRQGGSAADAALATLVALTVVEPQSSGIGGGGFLVYDDGKAAP